METDQIKASSAISDKEAAEKAHGCCMTSIVLLLCGIISAVLLSILRIKASSLAMNSIQVESLNGDLGRFHHPVSINATLAADVSVKNPNIVSFRFDASATEFYHKDTVIGVAHTPPGSVGAWAIFTVVVIADVLIDELVRQSNGGGEMNLTSYTDVKGRVNVLGLYERGIIVMLNCNMTLELSLSRKDAKNKVCNTRVRLLI